MTPERWQQLKELFGAALDRSGEERVAFLAQACKGDPALRAEVGRLLVSHERAGAFLDSPTVARGTDVPAAMPALGRIGPYQLLRELGHGGMGTVCLATRADQEYRKEVAVKIIRRGMDTDFVVSRFRNERQILAALVHPNIATLLDGGTTEDGLPYFVMEYIDGEAIDRYCDGRRLSISQRLELFLQVCGAVQYAHGRLVVHRDLKPGNILVTRDGVPKLLDFGLAKLLDPGAPSGEQTAAQFRFLTPAFASPEQIRGGPITTASDVYSLGALLYVLLTGHRAYGTGASSFDELARAACEEEPLKPSVVVLRQQEGPQTREALGAVREGTPEKLRRRLSGELDAIVLEAMRKDPERRYASVERLAGDIRSHLAGRPVSVRRASGWYRARKFVSRHRAGVVATALVVLSLAGGFVETSRQRARAERRFNDVRKLANSFLFEFHDAIENLPGSTKARELVVQRAQEYLDSLAREAGRDRDLQRELATAYEKLGDVLGRYPYANLGRTPEALASYRKALAIREALAAGPGAGAPDRLAFARSLSRIGDMQTRNGDLPGALESMRRGFAIRETVARGDPANTEAQSALTVSYNEVGSTLDRLGDTAGALEHFRNGLAIREKLVAAFPDNMAFKRGLGNNQGKIGDVLLSTGDMDGAAEAYRRALALFEAASAAQPAHVGVRHAIQETWQDLGLLEARRGNPGGALEHFAKALGICESLAAADPADVEPRREMALVLSRAGEVLLSAGRAPEGLSHFRRALAVAEGYAGRDSADPVSRHELARYQRLLGVGLASVGDREGALQSLGKALAIAEAVAAENPANAEFHISVAACRLELGRCHAGLASLSSPRRQMDHWRQARSWFQRSLDGWKDLEVQGRLKPSDAREREEAERGVAQSEAALAGGEEARSRSRTTPR